MELHVGDGRDKGQQSIIEKEKERKAFVLEAG